VGGKRSFPLQNVEECGTVEVHNLDARWGE